MQDGGTCCNLLLRRGILPGMRRTILILSTALVMAACGGGGAGRGAAPAPASTAELEALYRARTDSARMRFTEADVHFMTGMIGHHAQALVMSNLVPTHGSSAELRTLAARIINAQRDEIATMQRWLRDRGQTVPQVQISGTHLTVEGAEWATHMPGMLSPQQMDELDAAKGVAFDRLFLTDMIQHHQGAVAMVDELFGTDGAAQGSLTFKIASDIQVDQRTEIARMQRMLEAMPPS
jgi:uncharacterized protein (DUF305 family)